MMKFWQASAVAEGGAFCLTAMAQTLRSPFDRTSLEETCPTTQYAQYSAPGVRVDFFVHSWKIRRWYDKTELCD